MVHKPLFSQKLRQARGGHRVGHDDAAGILRGQHGGRQRNEPVAAQAPALRVDEGGAVGVGVKGDAELRVLLTHGAGQRGQIFLFFRVLPVSRAAPGRLEEKAA